MEEIKFKNTSRMDANEISLFQSYAMKKTIWMMAGFFALIFVGAGIGLAFWNTTVGIIMIVCGLAGGFWFLPYLMKESQKKQNMEVLGDRKYLNTYQFYEDHVFVTSTATADATSKEYNEVGTQRVDYKEVYKVVTYKDRLFIFINKTQSFILSFQGMTMGVIEDLVKFLKSKEITIVDKTNVITEAKQGGRK